MSKDTNSPGPKMSKQNEPTNIVEPQAGAPNNVAKLEEISGSKTEPKVKLPVYKSTRLYIISLALISALFTTYSKTIINFAITDMVLIKKSSSSSPHETMDYFLRDNSCPVDDETRERLNKQVGDHSDPDGGEVKQAGDKLDWSPWEQSFIKSAYGFGHIPFQLVGSRMSEIFGAQKVISFGTLLMATCCMAAPFLAASHFVFAFIDLLVLGIIGSFMTPALFTMATRWLAPSERNVLVTLYLFVCRLGMAMSSLLCGWLQDQGMSWRNAFFSSGWTGLIYGIIFYFVATNDPIDHPLVSERELKYLVKKNTLVRESYEAKLAEDEAGNKDVIEMSSRNNDGDTAANKEDDEQKEKVMTARKRSKFEAPWMAILTSAPVWAFVITKFSVKLSGDMIAIDLPSFLNRVMHATGAQNGQFNAMVHAMFCLGCVWFGFLAKWTIPRRTFGFEKTIWRKVFQCLASYGVGACLILTALSVCNYSATITFLLISQFITAAGVGGEAQIPVDISERYSGTIHALASMLSISSAIAPLIVGSILGDQISDRDRWKYVWLSAGAVSAAAGLIFMFFADAKIQPFDLIILESGKKNGGNGDDVEANDPLENSKGQKPKKNDEITYESSSRPEPNLESIEIKVDGPTSEANEHEVSAEDKDKEGGYKESKMIQ